MQIKKVAVLGAGAVGSYVIWGLSQAENLSLGVIAEGERAGRLKENGCLINGQVYRPEVWTPKEAHGADLLIVSLKYGALTGALDSIAQHCCRTVVTDIIQHHFSWNKFKSCRTK